MCLRLQEGHFLLIFSSKDSQFCPWPKGAPSRKFLFYWGFTHRLQLGRDFGRSKVISGSISSSISGDPVSCFKLTRRSCSRWRKCQTNLAWSTDKVTHSRFKICNSRNDFNISQNNKKKFFSANLIFTSIISKNWLTPKIIQIHSPYRANYQ